MNIINYGLDSKNHSPSPLKMYSVHKSKVSFPTLFLYNYTLKCGTLIRYYN